MEEFLPLIIFALVTIISIASKSRKIKSQEPSHRPISQQTTEGQSYIPPRYDEEVATDETYVNPEMIPHDDTPDARYQAYCGDASKFISAQSPQQVSDSKQFTTSSLSNFSQKDEESNEIESPMPGNGHLQFDPKMAFVYAEIMKPKYED